MGLGTPGMCRAGHAFTANVRWHFLGLSLGMCVVGFTAAFGWRTNFLFLCMWKACPLVTLKGKPLRSTWHTSERLNVVEVWTVHLGGAVGVEGIALLCGREKCFV